jgi:23S rRNA (pseudouridine1915-N3)-methyltransferase
MSRDLVVLWAGRHRRDEWEKLCEPFKRRISRQVRIREVAVRPKATQGDLERQKAEGDALLAAVPEGSWTIALDRRGKMRSSHDLATWLQKQIDDWPGPLVFLIGSDLGLASDVLAQTRERLSFGPLTLPHELARLVLLEQLYRGLAINAGIKYHREPL